MALLQPTQPGPPHLEQFAPAFQYLAELLPQAPAVPPVKSNGSDTQPPRTYSTPDYEHPWRRQGRAAYKKRQQLQQQKQN
jgi:hypothetical protein